MNNKKMIRIAKNLDIFANTAGKITFGIGIACIIIAICTLVFGSKMFQKGSFSLDLDFIKFYLADHTYINENSIKFYACSALAGSSLLCFLIYYISTLFRQILAPMKKGRPFEPGISENLKKTGWIVLIGGFLSELLEIAARVLLVKSYSFNELFASPAIEKTEYIFTMNFNFVLITCIMFFLSYIFKYGQLLQQDSDETL